MQGALTWLSIFTGNLIFIGVLILVGGGLIPAIVYPIMNLILMRDMHTTNSTIQRHMMLILAMVADIGQLIGGALLIFPNIYTIKLGVMAIPIVLCFCCLTNLVKSKNTTKVKIASVYK